jgi:branched-chain amino acid transport system ATP-binding protein
MVSLVCIKKFGCAQREKNKKGLKDMALLESHKLTMRFGGLNALSDIEMEIREGEILGLIGPNGAGKSTFINVVSGVYKPTDGTIKYREENIAGLRTDEIASKGIIRTFQASNLFMTFSVLQNILVGLHLSAGIGFWEALLGGGQIRRKQHSLNDKALALLSYFGMDHLKNELASNLPHGYRRILGVAMALAAEPRLLMLDEPVTGMIAAETLNFMKIIKKIVLEKKVTILLIEHDMKTVMAFCDRLVVLNFGKIIAEGTPREIQLNEGVIKAYLGEKRDVQSDGSGS